MKKNNAFTMAELVFVFIFIGVVSVIAMHTINNRFTDYYTRYNTAYEALSKAIYNIYTDTYVTQDCPKREVGRPFPINARQLRLRLAEYLNVLPEYQVKKCKDVRKKYCQQCDENLEDDNIKKIKNLEDNDNIEDFEKQFQEEENKIVQLKLSNGFRYYFSDLAKIEIPFDLKYFIVYVDLNGSAKPNRATQHPEFKSGLEKRPSATTARPDIVPFIVTERGDVIPIGFPIYDRSYISARVINDKNEQSKSYTFNEARIFAFGNSEIYSDIPVTMIPTFNEVLNKFIKPSKDEIHNQLEYGVEIKTNNESFDEHSYNCKEGTYNCNIKIDANVGKRY